MALHRREARDTGRSWYFAGLVGNRLFQGLAADEHDLVDLLAAAVVPALTVRKIEWGNLLPRERVAEEMKAKKYTVTFERDADGWWVASVRGVHGVHTQGRAIDEARRRVREALSLAIGDDAAERAELVDDVRVPAAVKRALAELKRARAAEATASA